MTCSLRFRYGPWSRGRSSRYEPHARSAVAGRPARLGGRADWFRVVPFNSGDESAIPRGTGVTFVRRNAFHPWLPRQTTHCQILSCQTGKSENIHSMSFAATPARWLGSKLCGLCHEHGETEINGDDKTQTTKSPTREPSSSTANNQK